MKLSLCPRSSFPQTTIAETAHASSDLLVDAASPSVDALPPSNTAGSGGWLQTRVYRDDDPRTES